MASSDFVGRGRAAARRAGARIRRLTRDDALAPAERWVLNEADQALAARTGSRSVVVLVGSAPSLLVRMLAVGHPGVRVMAVRAASAAPSLHAVLAASGPYAVIAVTLAAGGEAADLGELYRSLVFHLAPGGRLLVADSHPGRPAPTGMWPVVHRAVALREEGVAPAGTAEEQALADATRTVKIVGRRLSVTGGPASLAKLRDHEVDHVLRVRGPRVGEVITRLDGETYAPRARIVDYRDGVAERRLPLVTVPPVSLRRYSGAVLAPRQITTLDNLLLPDTYRHHLWPELATTGTTDRSPLFATIGADVTRAAPVQGSVFQLDSEFSGHFGHLMTEQLSRLWAWREAKERYPDLRVAIHRNRTTDPPTETETALFAAAGIEAADILTITKPIRPERVLAATPMFTQPNYASRRLAQVWGRIGAAAVRGAGLHGAGARVFISRRRKARTVHNLAEVEETFRDAGFTIAYPEDLPFADQVALFRDADVVAGFAGSGMFTMCLCDKPKRILLLCSEGYIPQNEYLICSVRGHRMDIFWSEPDSRVMNAPFAVDFDREGRHLRRILGELDQPGAVAG